MTYEPQTASRICEELSSGRSLRSICGDEGMPDKATVFRWLAADETFRDQYARAREAQADAMLEDILDIADQYDNLQEKLDVEHIQRAKLRIDTRKWAMSKMAPKKYGDKVVNELTGTIDANLTHQGEVAISATAAFLAEALASGSGPAHSEPGED